MIQKSIEKVDQKYIQSLASKIKQQFHPEKIILFGSYGYGAPHRASDIDLLVIMQTDIPVREQAFLIRREIREPISVDVIVRTPQQIEERIRQGDFFIREIVRKGKEL